MPDIIIFFFFSESDGETKEQSGGGETSAEGSSSDVLNDRLVTRLSDIIASKLEQRYKLQPITPYWKSFDVSEPTISSEVIPEQTKPPIGFGVEIVPTEMSDKFDAKRLLLLVPKPQRQKAISLLDIFENQPNDISFDTAGNVYINSESIPNSNVSHIFPALFKKGTNEANVPGLKDVVAKLTQMNVIHLTNRNPSHSLKVKGPQQAKQIQKTNWWYLK